MKVQGESFTPALTYARVFSPLLIRLLAGFVALATLLPLMQIVQKL